MSIRHTRRRALIVAVMMFVSASVTMTPAASITNLGVLPGGTASYANGVSADGSAVVGTGDSSGGNRAFRWTAAIGIQSLGVLPGTQLTSYGYAISADGSAVVGRSGEYHGARPFRWTAAEEMEDLGLLPGTSYSSAYGISGDGLTVVGGSRDIAVCWTVGGGIEDLGLPRGSTGGQFPTFFGSYANAISGNGSTIIGDTWYQPWDGKQGYGAWRWTSRGSKSLDLSDASAISADGSAVVGTISEGYSWEPILRAWRWTSTTGYEDLGALPGGASDTVGSAISGDGLSVGGGSAGRAFLWTGELGMVDLNTYLASLGVNLTGWVLTDARGLSYDGSVIVGNGYFSGQPRGWLAVVPEPGTGPVLAFVVLLAQSRRTFSTASATATA